MSNESENILTNLCNDNGDFKVLPSCMKYKKLDEENNINACEEECKKCKEDICKECKECKECIECNQENYKETCEKICHRLIKLSTILSDESSLGNRCSYFNYWTYEQLWKKYNSSSSSNSSTQINTCVLNALHKLIWSINESDNVKNNPCYFYFDGTFSDWKNEKYLHDYFKNHDHIKSNGGSNNDESKYCKYVTSILTLYEKYSSYCCTYFFFGHYWDHCPNFYKCNKDYSPYKLLNKLKCHGELPPYPEKLVQSSAIDFYVILKSQMSKFKKLTYDSFYVTTSILFTVLAIFYLIFLFYKFTPLGSFIDRKSHKKKQIKNNFQENSKQKLPSRKLQRGHGNDRKKKIYISYNS
ncbi:variable surface protein [Plasmodium gonderi]|uniref:Variable surface protein n=1 Tax=Plasmodium gonderi TaxID=77519 RepID=A0A1Y1JGT4_PLAGO|nr:variable surface protein [Plasmodium gonderi]GAW80427.1 variable surface protein [Plasmodium gonderi]